MNLKIYKDYITYIIREKYQYKIYLTMLKDQRQNPETSRVGLKWEQDDIDKLLNMVKDDITIEEMANVLQRTPGSVKTRLVLFALKQMQTDDLTMEDSARMYNISPEDISDYNTKKAEREEKRNNKSPKKSKVITNNQIYELLLKIQTKMQYLTNK